MTLFERLRDAPAVCMIPLQGGVGTPTVGLTDRERAAVLNLIEAAQLLAFGMTDEDAIEAGLLQTVRRAREAVAVFVSGQEEP